MNNNIFASSPYAQTFTNFSIVFPVIFLLQLNNNIKSTTISKI